MARSRCGARIVPFLAGLALAGLACGAEIGASCDEHGSTDECVDGGACTNEGGTTGYFSGYATCRVICVDQARCAPGLRCNGVSNTNLKSCQPG
jgi:hypothetical protein